MSRMSGDDVMTPQDRFIRSLHRDAATDTQVLTRHVLRVRDQEADGGRHLLRTTESAEWDESAQLLDRDFSLVRSAERGAQHRSVDRARCHAGCQDALAP